jgi:hypothetical protein
LGEISFRRRQAARPLRAATRSPALTPPRRSPAPRRHPLSPSPPTTTPFSPPRSYEVRVWDHVALSRRTASHRVLRRPRRRRHWRGSPSTARPPEPTRSVPSSTLVCTALPPTSYYSRGAWFRKSDESGLHRVCGGRLCGLCSSFHARLPALRAHCRASKCVPLPPLV